MTFRRVVSLFIISFALTAFGLTAVHAQAMTPTKIESTDVQPSGGWLFESGFDWETGRTLISDYSSGGMTDDLEYDNIRIHPLSLKYGITDWIQFGVGTGYSMNSADNDFNAVDEGGFEGLSFNSKFQWNQNIATTFELGFLGSDEAYPYSNDGFNFGLNIPMQMSLGPGTLNGELGYTIQSGDATITGCVSGVCSSSTGDREGYINYGIGYVYEVNRTFGLSGELRGHGETVENGESILDLTLGTPIRMTEASHLKPALTLGLSDGSPSFALGLDYGMKFGNQERYESDQTMGSERRGRQQMGQRQRTTSQRNQQQQEEDPLVMPDEQQNQQQGRTTNQQQMEQRNQGGQGPITPSASPNQQAGQQEQQTGPTYNPERAAELAQRGRRAFEQGNYQQAIDLYSQAAQNDPTNVEYQSNLGSLHYRQGNYEQAREHYQQAVQIDPRDYFSHLYLGATHYQLGNADQAREHFNRVLEIQPDNEQAQQWLDRLNN